MIVYPRKGLPYVLTSLFTLFFNYNQIMSKTVFIKKNS